MRQVHIGFIIVIGLLVQSCNDNPIDDQGHRLLSFEFLTNSGRYEQAVPLTEFTPLAGATMATNRFSGRLRLNPEKQDNLFVILNDELDFLKLDRPGMQDLPPFDFEFIQTNGYLVPVVRGPIANDHNWWEFVLGPGRVWNEEADAGFSRAALPFALKEQREDCLHNGLMTFLFNEHGEVSKVAFQISSQTCRYLQFELGGLLAAEYVPAEITNKEQVVAAFEDEIASRMPQQAMSELAVDYAGADPSSFGSVEEISPESMTVFGFVIDGKHYVGGCDTPYGVYPYCDQMALPSYSTAKSIVGGLALMRAEKVLPGTANALVEDYVPECGDSWDGVTIEHALDLTTGHYLSESPHEDENAAIVSRFFLGEDHATKIDFACNEYPRKADPGVHWSYQTWSTYLAGTAINNRFKSEYGDEFDFYRDLLVDPIWKPLHLSPLSYGTRRTNDAVAQPFTGFGLTLLRDDIAKIANFIGASDGRIDGADVLDRSIFDAIKQRIPDDPGMIAEFDKIRYNNGFRTFDAAEALGCEEPTWLTTMSGFGGINIVLMPNDTAYYYFSDGNVHRYLSAVRESHKIRPMCNQDPPGDL